jgi:hypothetical protein
MREVMYLIDKAGLCTNKSILCGSVRTSIMWEYSGPLRDELIQQIDNERQERKKYERQRMREG